MSNPNTIQMDFDIDKLKPEFSIGTPRTVTFRAPAFVNDDGNPASLALNFRLFDGDVYAMLGAVEENGGVGVMDPDGVYRFIPWPCAVVEVREG